MKQTKTIAELLRNLRTKDEYREFSAKQRWHGEQICPHCLQQSKRHYKLDSKEEFRGLYKCYSRHKRFGVTVGTMFEGKPYRSTNGSMQFLISYPTIMYER